MQKIKLSIALKTILIIFVMVGVGLSYHYGYAKHYKCFFYFTQQSNLMIGLVDFILLFSLIKGLKKPNYELTRRTTLIYEIFSSAILLTGIVFCFVLAPAFLISGKQISEIEWNTYFFPSFIMHVIVPILAFLDLCLTLRTNKLKSTDAYYAALFPLAYFIFATIGYLTNLDFYQGENYPYFFLNYGSPAGLIGFSNEAPYYMGSFYWIVIGFSLVILISWVLIKITRIKTKEKI